MAKTWDVTAICLDPRTCEVVAPARTERITPDNTLFANLNTPWEVEDLYEAFWNRLQDDWQYRFPSHKEKVKVLSVVEVAE